MKVTKEQIKRDETLKKYLTIKLNNLLLDFKNDYLNDYYQFNVNSLEAIKMDALTKIDEAEKNTSLPSYRIDTLIQSLNYKITKINKILTRKALMQLDTFNEANESFNKKLNNLIDKLVSENISQRHMKLEKVSHGNANDFSIFISDDKMEIESRFIYANGEIKAPHYRFITTKRTK